MCKPSVLQFCKALFIALVCAVQVNAKNDQCSDALRLFPDEPVSGDNSFATPDFDDNAACGPNSRDEGVWYEIIGTGKEVNVKVCTKNNRILSVGILNGCNGQNCVGFAPMSTSASNCEENKYVQYSFFAESERTYYIHVRANVVQIDNSMMGAEFQIHYTTDTPTAAPTLAPTVAPTQTQKPTPLSLAPTSLPYKVSDSGTWSNCIVSPPSGFRTDTKLLGFDYKLPVASVTSSPNATVARIERELLRSLAEKTMNCLYENEEPYSIFEINTDSPDEVSPDVCETESGETCILVNGSIKMNIAFPGRRRALSTEVVDDLIPIFRSALSELNAVFEGFTNVETGDIDKSPTDDDQAPGNNVDQGSNDEDPGTLLILIVAVCVLLLLFILLCVRRKLKKEKSEKRVIDDLDLDRDFTMEAPGQQVDDNDFGGDDESEEPFDVRLESSNHDFRSCGKPDCENCKAGSRTTFVPTHESAELKRTHSYVLGAEPMRYNDGWARFDEKESPFSC
eukprot:scaffold154_cov129-Cylindrotheca_fusiformis.AAC.12